MEEFHFSFIEAIGTQLLLELKRWISNLVKKCRDGLNIY